MQFPGKLQSRREKEELNSLPVGSFLIYLQDILSNRNFLVDTGASRSARADFLADFDLLIDVTTSFSNPDSRRSRRCFSF